MKRRAADLLGPLAAVAPEALLALSLDGEIRQINGPAARLLGSRHDDALGKPLHAWLAPAQAAHLDELLGQWASNGSLSPASIALQVDGALQTFRAEGARTADGSQTHIVLRLTSQAQASSRFRLLSATVSELELEVRERRRTERLLEAQLQILRLIISGTPLAEVLKQLVLVAESYGSRNLTASILLLNDTGTHLVKGAAPNIAAEYNDAIDGLAIGPCVGSCGTAAYRNETVVAQDINTDPLWADYKQLALAQGFQACWSTPIPSREGVVLGTVALYYPEPLAPPPSDHQVVDTVTRLASIAIERAYEEARLERILASERAARAEAEQADRAKDEFLALVSHELRNPLNAMLGWTRLLRMAELDEETRAQGVETIERNAELQAQLIADMLDFSRAASGQLTLDLHRHDVADLVDTAISSMLPQASAARVELNLRAERGAFTLCDGKRVQQVIANLLGNAIKFTPAGGRVDTSIERRGKFLRLQVKDTGQGIDPAFLPHVFDAFRQADASTTRPHAGLGLGLAIVQRLVELHGGRVAAKSEGKGRGATFCVDLPITDAARPAGRGTAASGSGLETDLSGLRVLAVDDELDARQLVGTILMRFGAEVTLTASASEAISALDEADGAGFDVLVSDISMPEMDGLALMQVVRKRNDRFAQLPAVALTAHARNVDRRRAYAAGFQRHLAKPVEPRQLLSVIAQLAGRQPPI